MNGVVTAVGASSLTVSDIVFEASHAVVFVNGICATLADVYVGATATVEGDVDAGAHSGTAFTIYADESVVGPIRSIDIAAGKLNVNGQAVLTTPSTLFGDDIQPAQLSTLQQENMIAVSGSLNQDGILVATRIHRWPTNAYDSVAGIVTSVDTSTGLLQVSGVQVRYADSVLLGFSGGTVHVGDHVRALGQSLAVEAGYDGENGIDAAAIQHTVEPAADARKDIVLAGAVSNVRSADDFDIMGQPVKMYGSTRKAGLLMDLVNWGPSGYFLTVFGSLDPSGYVIADLVVAQNGSTLRVTGPITAIDRPARTVDVIGIPVRVSGTYSYVERDGQATKFDALNVGDQLAVEGSTDDTGLVNALIARQSAPSLAVSLNNSGWSPLDSHQPIIVMIHGTQTDTTHAQFFWGHPLGAGCSCSDSSSNRFWNYPHFDFLDVQVYGTWTGDHIDASKVFFLEE